MSDITEDAAVERMARAAYESACRRMKEDLRRVLKPWPALGEQVRNSLLLDQQAALAALAAGALPAAVMRRAIEELMARAHKFPGSPMPWNWPS